MSSIIKIIFLVLILSSCNGELTQKECEILSMKKFKGIPSASHKFDKECNKKEIIYTAKKCQAALNILVMGTTEKALQKQFGPLIINCFTKNDLEKFPLST